MMELSLIVSYFLVFFWIYGEILAKSYTCLASWKHDDRLLIYANRGTDEKECFVTHFQDGKLYVAATGDQCERNIDFAKNQELIMVLEEKREFHPFNLKWNSQIFRNMSKTYNEITKTNETSCFTTFWSQRNIITSFGNNGNNRTVSLIWWVLVFKFRIKSWIRIIVTVVFIYYLLNVYHKSLHLYSLN